MANFILPTIEFFIVWFNAQFVYSRIFFFYNRFCGWKILPAILSLAACIRVVSLSWLNAYFQRLNRSNFMMSLINQLLLISDKRQAESPHEKSTLLKPRWEQASDCECTWECVSVYTRCRQKKNQWPRRRFIPLKSSFHLPLHIYFINIVWYF